MNNHRGFEERFEQSTPYPSYHTFLEESCYYMRRPEQQLYCQLLEKTFTEKRKKNVIVKSIKHIVCRAQNLKMYLTAINVISSTVRPLVKKKNTELQDGTQSHVSVNDI